MLLTTIKGYNLSQRSLAKASSQKSSKNRA
jgi:hypothetical protein